MTLRTLLFTLFLSTFTVSAVAADRAEIERKVGELDRQSIKLLGVSLNALTHLVKADPQHYLPVRYLERSGEINYIRELETRGYVRTQVVQGLPDGQEKHEKFLRMIPVGEGIHVQECVIALQQKSAVRRTP